MITDGTARRIAAEWQGGTPHLAALASSGAIDADGALDEIVGNLADLAIGGPGSIGKTNADDETTAREDLRALRTYVQHHGGRTPVAGWAQVDFEYPADR